MPSIAIGGGFTLLAVLLCILVVRARGVARRRRARLAARRTSFHVAVIDPRIATLGRAAFEEVVPVRAQPKLAPPPVTLAFVPPPPRPDMRVRMHYLQREPQQPRRMARGSTPGIVPAPQAHTRADEWDVPTAASVTAQRRVFGR